MGTKGIRAILAAAALLGLLIAGSAAAQPGVDEPFGQGSASVASVVSPLLQYQGRLSDPSTGEPVEDGDYTMSFSLYASQTGGAPLWTEEKSVSVQGGLFSTALGDTTALDLGLFNGRALWLGIAVEGDPEATPRQPVLPVAYAMSLVPGAQISTTSTTPALTLTNNGTGDALAVQGSTTADGALSVSSGISGNSQFTSDDGIVGFGGEGDWDAGVVGYGQSGSHGMGVVGWGQATSGESYGVWGSSVAPQGAGVYGETSDDTGGFNTAGVHGRSTHAETFGVLGESDDGIGVEGRISELSNTNAAVTGYNTGGGPGVEGYSENDVGVYGDGASYGGHFVSSTGKALRADGDVDVNGDLSVTGSLSGGAHTHSGDEITRGTVSERWIDPEIARDSEIVPTILDNDGAGSRLDADLLDGQHGSAFAAADHDHWGEAWSGKASTGLSLSGGTTALFGSGSDFGLSGGSSEGTGVYGSSESGVGVEGRSSLGSGVLGESDSASGVSGYSPSGSGVHGKSIYGPGGYFTSTKSHGLRAESSSTASGNAAVFGSIGTIGGWPSQEVGVRGEAADGFGVAGLSSTSTGVYGFSSSSYGVMGTTGSSSAAVYGYNSGFGNGVYGSGNNGNGVYGFSTDAYGGYFYSVNGMALRAVGDAEVTGDLNVGGSVTGGDGTTLPVAYGVVDDDGSVASASPNVSSKWNSTYSRYEITIDDHSYWYRSYVTNVTFFSACGYGYTPLIASAGGDLLVYVYDRSGNKVQCDFQFVTYKP